MKHTRAYVINIKKIIIYIAITVAVFLSIICISANVKKEIFINKLIEYSISTNRIKKEIPVLNKNVSEYKPVTLIKVLSFIFNENLEKPSNIFSDKIGFIKSVKNELSEQYNFVNESNNYYIPKIFKSILKDDNITYNPATETTINSVKKSGNILERKGIIVDNKTTYSLNLLNLYNEKLTLNKVKGKPQVLIVHTHGSESYNPTDRSQDINNNIVRVGSEMAKVFKENNIEVIHSEKMHDIPKFNNSYKNSLLTVNEMLEKYPSICVVLDVHRDAMISESGEVFKVVKEAGGVKYSQVMFVVGTNQGGLTHNNWKENLKFAMHCQEKINEIIPNLARPINLRQERFNQHTTNASLIIEVGTNGNTLIESVNSAVITAKAISEVLNSY